MQNKFLWIGLGVLLLVVVIGAILIVRNSNQLNRQMAPVAVMAPPAATPPPSATTQPAASHQTNADQVDGVDLSTLDNEATAAGNLATQDGAADVHAMATDGASANTSLDAVNNPIQ